MAGKRKVHTKSDLAIPTIAHRREEDGTVVLTPSTLPPAVRVVTFPPNPSTVRNFDFSPFYGHGIDEITYACQRQIERFIAKQDGEREVSTVVGYTNNSLANFLPYLMLRSAALRRPLSLADINRDVIDGFLRHLADSAASINTQRSRLTGTKLVLTALGRRGLLKIETSGDHRTFPANPFPNSARHTKGQKPLSRKEREAFTAAVKTAVMPIFRENVEVTGELLGYALLIVALHTGRNTTPLLEMVPDCLRPHPKENTQFLVLWKRRGHNSSKVALRDSSAERSIEDMLGVRLPVIRLIRRVIELASQLRDEAPDHLKDRVWLYRSKANSNLGVVTALTDYTLYMSIKRLVACSDLRADNGNPLRINISRLRKTFANRVFELLDGNLAGTAIALGNSPQVAGRNYMAPNENSQRNWKFMGQVMTNELMTHTMGATERTPAGACSDPTNGQYAPKRDGIACFNFLNCLRCRNYVVTGEDLYKLFSFYWRVLRERDRMDAWAWRKYYAHIPRLIERDVVARGIDRKVFTAADVGAARDRARADPHPYWQFDAFPSLDEIRTSSSPLGNA